MAKAGKTGVTANTPARIMLGAGTIHKGLKYTAGTDGKGSWNFEQSIVGATSGGSSLSIKPEIVNIEADGALVAVKGLTVKTGEVAELKVNMLELTPDVIKSALIASVGTSDDAGYDVYESKANVEEGDYWENIAFVGKTLDGRNIIAILDNALCTSGMELGGENKKESVGEYTFVCHADLASNLDTLPYHIYYPKAS